MKQKPSRGFAKSVPPHRLAAEDENAITSDVARGIDVELRDATSDTSGRLQYFTKQRSTGVRSGCSSYDVLERWKTCQYKRPQTQQEVFSRGWKHLGCFAGSLLRAVDLRRQSVRDSGGNQRS